MMATWKPYFREEFYAICGIPSVTLHGTKSDWEHILQMIEKLKEFERVELTMWYHLLQPVLSRFVKAWDDPDGEWNKQFWGRVATPDWPDTMCGEPRHLTGWLTAFMPFNDNGR